MKCRKPVKEIDYMLVYPTFQDLYAIAKNPKAVFPYKCGIFAGNNSEAIAKIVRPRGFTKVRSAQAL